MKLYVDTSAKQVTVTLQAQLKDGVIVEHWANRDDLGMARQLGWIPPSPAFLFKMARAKRRALRTPAR